MCRAVSIPPPIYYADLMCTRVKLVWESLESRPEAQQRYREALATDSCVYAASNGMLFA